MYVLLLLNCQINELSSVLVVELIDHREGQHKVSHAAVADLGDDVPLHLVVELACLPEDTGVVACPGVSCVQPTNGVEQGDRTAKVLAIGTFEIENGGNELVGPSILVSKVLDQ